MATILNSRVDATSDAIEAGILTGEVKIWPAATIPDGWLLCDGSIVSRETYASLFSVIGTTWGEGDGATTFALPSFPERILMGAGSTVSIAGTAGASTVTLDTDNLPAHAHDITDPGHTHAFTGAEHNHTVTDAGHAHTVTDPGHAHTVTDPGHTHADAFVDDAAGTEYVNTAGDKGTVQAEVASAVTGVTVDSNTTGVTVDSNTTGVTVDNATAGGTNASAVTGVTVDEAGGGQEFSVLPPIVGINFIIKT